MAPGTICGSLVEKLGLMISGMVIKMIDLHSFLDKAD